MPHTSSPNSSSPDTSPDNSPTPKKSPSPDNSPSPEQNALSSACLPPLFTLGRVVATPGALDALLDARLDAFVLLERHGRGDWGDQLSPDDIQANNEALSDGGRLFSSYQLPKDAGKVWVITEADRSSTTLLLPSEY